MKSAGAVICAMLLVVAMLLLLYVLLLGPAVWMHERGILEKQIEIAYAPLEWTAEYISFLEPVLRPYVDLWSSDTPSPPPTPTPLTAPAPAGS